MNYNKLGKSGLKVSEIALGSWLTYGKSVDENTSFKCIEKAYELGINYFDTANNYNSGQSEIILGKALNKYERESYVVATKGFHPQGKAPNQKGLSRKYIVEQVENSLRRLKLDYVDIWFCHKFDHETPLDETLRAIDDLVTQGKILYPGVSKWTVTEMNMALDISEKLGLDPIIVDQPLYNLLQRDIEQEIIPFCIDQGIGIVTFSPLAQGLLTGKYHDIENPPKGSRFQINADSKFTKQVFTRENIQYAQQLKEIADTKDCTLSQLSLAWVLQHSGISSTIIGASHPQQIEENVKALEIEFTKTELAQIEEVSSNG